MATTVGQRIRKKRLENGLTQQELYLKTNIPQPTIANLENDKAESSDEQLKKISKYLGKINRNRDRENIEEQEEYEISTFGVWLNKTRVEKKMSVPELSEKTKISIPTIYGIESGRVSTPRESTRSILEKALGTNIPKDLETEIKEDSEIKGIGEFASFDPYNIDELPKEGGIYVLYDISDRPIYVGQSDNIKRRIKAQSDKFWFKKPIVENGAYVAIADGDQRVKIESILIKFLKSNAVINKQHVSRDNFD